MKPIHLAVCCVLLAIAWPSCVQGQTIRGTLTEAPTDRPIPFGELVLLSEGGEVLDRTAADGEGAFTFGDPIERAGPYLLRAYALGYRETTRRIEASGRDTLTVHVELEVQAVELDTLTAEVERRRTTLIENGFVDRVEEGRGDFVTPVWIEEREPADLKRVFQMLPRAYFKFRPSEGRRVLILKDGRHECDEPDIWIDGLRIPRGVRLDQLGVPIQDLKAMEVYRDPTAAPPGYGGGLMRGMAGRESSCGIVLIWTWAQR